MDNCDAETDDNGAVGEESEWDERVSSAEPFPDSESNDRDTSANQKGDAVTVRPTGSLSVCNRYGDEDHAESSDEEKETEKIELPEDGLDFLPGGAIRALLRSKGGLGLVADLYPTET